ncbi:hypothetical protein JTB14_024280 [Gonioctena quinquepunctata]|nr:hypothetical protein JTB14_024280 [Gonioctena quinquepunctata]
MLKKLTDSELLKILENSDSDEFDFVDGDSDGWGSSDDGGVDVDLTTQASNDLFQDSDVPTGNPNNKAVIIDWKVDPTDMKSIPFLKTESLLIPPNGNSPIDYFRHIMSDNFLQAIVEETNTNAEDIFLSRTTKEKSRIYDWKNLTLDELLVFLGIFLHRGNVKLKRLQDYWEKYPFFHCKAIADSMGRNRFLIILRSLHFYRNPRPGEPTPEDRLYKIRPVINFFNERMAAIYYPCQQLSLDESMVLWRRRLVQKIAVYTGMLDEIGGRGHAQKVVLHWMENKLNVGHHLYMDNYYNSFDLAKNLLDQGTDCTGTLRLDRKNVPIDVKNAKTCQGQYDSQICRRDYDREMAR